MRQAQTENDSTRIAQERAMLDAGDRDLREGRRLDDDAMDAWLDRWVAGATTDELLAHFEDLSRA